ncbi:hypothetical protein MACK_001354 [Theileria orientalis]|uniref:Uncharacterized protein n=1 Tax=Theileria orientalis TaxID=68886 RepID=A0A976MCT4_THEOR|nr:hypothetical protein MACK_001354 [Theileria orientalis]
MACSQSSILEECQMRSVADSLKPTGSRFDNEISYEINGCILTWIANDEAGEYRFDCSNIIEIIDGYYKAEFYLDTKRIFEAPNIIDSYDNNIQVELTNYIEEDHPKAIPPQVEKSNLHNIYTISSASTEAESLHENLNGSRKNGTQFTQANNTKQSETRLTTSRGARASSTNNTLTKYMNSSNGKQGTKAERPKEKSPTIQKKPMETRRQTGSTFTLRSSRATKLPTTPTNIYSRENTRAFAATHARVATPAIEPVFPAADLKKRKYTKPETPKRKPEVEVRRGERVRKVSIFQDCYIPAARNEWISEVFIGAHKENF